MNKKILVGIVLIAFVIISLSGCINQTQEVNTVEEEKVSTGNNITGTVYEVILNSPPFMNEEFQSVDITFLDNKTTAVLTVYRYYDHNQNNFDWYERLTELKDKKITVYYALDEYGSFYITSIECSNRE